MAEITPGRSDTWHLSQDTRDDERLSDLRARAWAEYERAGWVRFVELVLITLGAFQIVNGLIALFRSETYLVGADRLVVDVGYTTWGWVHIVLGALAVAAAFGLQRGRMWGRVLGVALAMVSALVSEVRDVHRAIRSVRPPRLAAWAPASGGSWWPG